MTRKEQILNAISDNCGIISRENLAIYLRENYGALIMPGWQTHLQEVIDKIPEIVTFKHKVNINTEVCITSYYLKAI